MKTRLGPRNLHFNNVPSDSDTDSDKSHSGKDWVLVVGYRIKQTGLKMCKCPKVALNRSNKLLLQISVE